MNDPENVVAMRPDCGTCFRDRKGLAVRLETEIAAIANVYADDLAGYVIVAVNGKGENTIGFAVDDSSPIGLTMLSGLATAAIIRKVTISD